MLCSADSNTLVESKYIVSTRLLCTKLRQAQLRSSMEYQDSLGGNVYSVVPRPRKAIIPIMMLGVEIREGEEVWGLWFLCSL